MNTKLADKYFGHKIVKLGRPLRARMAGGQVTNITKRFQLTIRSDFGAIFRVNCYCLDGLNVPLLASNKLCRKLGFNCKGRRPRRPRYQQSPRSTT